MARHHGYRRKTRSVFTKKRNRGLSVSLRNYSVGEKVVIDIDPSQVKGMPHRRYQGLAGTIVIVMRRVVHVEVPLGEKMKTIISRLEHITPHKG